MAATGSVVERASSACATVAQRSPMDGGACLLRTHSRWLVMPTARTVSCGYFGLASSITCIP